MERSYDPDVSLLRSSDILLNISFCFPQKDEIHKGLEQHEHDGIFLDESVSSLMKI